MFRKEYVKQPEKRNKKAYEKTENIRKMLEWRILRPHEYCCVKLAINGSMEIINYKMSNSPNKQQVCRKRNRADCKTCKRF